MADILDAIMAFVTGLSRIALPSIAVIVFIKCILALWLGHPKEKTYGYIIDMRTGSRHALNMWETSIGRGFGCDVTLKYDTVARNHAVITRRIDGWYIYDVSPAKINIKINGTKIEKKGTVVDGDIITLGTMRFRFEVADDPVVKIGKVKKNSKKKKSSAAAPAPQKAQPSAPVYDIDKKSAAPTETKKTAEDNTPSQPRIINEDTGESFVLCGNEITIGSSRGCDIRLHGSQIARKHALLVLFEDGWAVDIISKDKPVYLNGVKINAPNILMNKDVIAIGDERLFFRSGRRRKTK